MLFRLPIAAVAALVLGICALHTLAGAAFADEATGAPNPAPVASTGSVEAGQLFKAAKADFTKPGATSVQQAVALKELLQAADLGDADAMNFLGTIFAADPRIGNAQKSFEWDLKAAEAGNTLSMTRVGNDYIDGRGVAKDQKTGVSWYRRAIALGSPAGMNGLAGAYQNGWGVPQDIDKAVSWYQKAADGGHPQASFMVGISYLTGQGHTADPQKAADYIYAALRKGYRQARSALLNTQNPGTAFAKALQEHLIKDGFLKGTADGKFGPQTFGAINAAFGTVKDTTK